MSVEFLTDELVLTVPEGATDKTANLLEWAVDGDTIQLTILRDASPKRRSPAELLAAASREYDKRFALYRPEPAPEIDLPFPHAVAAFTWKRDHSAVLQVQAFVELGARLVIVTVTGRTKQRELVVDLAQKTLESLTLRSGGE